MMFYTGDKVRISKEVCEWLLSEEAREGWVHPNNNGFPPEYYIEQEIITEHMNNKNHYGIIISCSWFGSDDENYLIKLDDIEIHIVTRELTKFKRIIRNIPEAVA